MATSWWLPWLLGGLFLAQVSSSVLAEPQDDAQGGDAEQPADVESDIESPVSNPEIADAPALDASNFFFGDWGGLRSALAAVDPSSHR